MTKAAFRPSDEVDFLVIGAGAAGGVMAKELASSGFRVVVLEQGPYLTEAYFSHDELKYTMMPGLTNDPKVQPITYRKSEHEPAKLKRAIEYGRQVGGGSVHFTSNYWRFHESDFRERSLFGDVAGASLADWPISYHDLEPYYTKAEYELGISGLAGANPFDGPRSKPYPLPPMPVKSSGVLFERATRKMGLHPFRRRWRFYHVRTRGGQHVFTADSASPSAARCRPSRARSSQLFRQRRRLDVARFVRTRMSEKLRLTLRVE
jgi:choline dehydrogenase-like flavoprotein